MVIKRESGINVSWVDATQSTNSNLVKLGLATISAKNLTKEAIFNFPDTSGTIALKSDIVAVKTLDWSAITNRPAFALKIDIPTSYDWSRITNKPSIPKVPTTYSWAAITDKPDIALKSDIPAGYDWSKITNKPIIPDSFHWNEIENKPDIALKSDIPLTYNWAAILNKPDFVFKSEIPIIPETYNWSQITDKPDIALKKDIPLIPTTYSWDSITGKPDIALKSDIPVIPLTYTWSAVINKPNLALKSDIPSSYDWALVTNKPNFALKSELPIVPTTHDWGAITNKPNLALKTDIPTALNWSTITGKPVEVFFQAEYKNGIEFAINKFEPVVFNNIVRNVNVTWNAVNKSFTVPAGTYNWTAFVKLPNDYPQCTFGFTIDIPTVDQNRVVWIQHARLLNNISRTAHVNTRIVNFSNPTTLQMFIFVDLRNVTTINGLYAELSIARLN